MSSRDFYRASKNEWLDIVEGSAPSETKEEPARRVRAGDVGAPATLGSFAHIDRKKDGGSISGPTGILSGSRSGRAALRSCRRVISMTTKPRGRKARSITEVTNTALGKGAMTVRR
jgi:hypothetical protein